MSPSLKIRFDPSAIVKVTLPFSTMQRSAWSWETISPFIVAPGAMVIRRSSIVRTLPSLVAEPSKCLRSLSVTFPVTLTLPIAPCCAGAGLMVSCISTPTATRTARARTSPAWYRLAMRCLLILWHRNCSAGRSAADDQMLKISRVEDQVHLDHVVVEKVGQTDLVVGEDGDGSSLDDKISFIRRLAVHSQHGISRHPDPDTPGCGIVAVIHREVRSVSPIVGACGDAETVPGIPGRSRYQHGGNGGSTAGGTIHSQQLWDRGHQRPPTDANAWNYGLVVCDLSCHR